MTRGWIKEVTPERVEPDVSYFLGKKWTWGETPHCFTEYLFLSQNKKREVVMSGKPGLAIYIKGARIKELMAANPSFNVVIEIPSDAHKRWTRR